MSCGNRIQYHTMIFFFFFAVLPTVPQWCFSFLLHLFVTKEYTEHAHCIQMHALARSFFSFLSDLTKHSNANFLKYYVVSFKFI